MRAGTERHPANAQKPDTAATAQPSAEAEARQPVVPSHPPPPEVEGPQRPDRVDTWHDEPGSGQSGPTTRAQPQPGVLSAVADRAKGAAPPTAPSAELTVEPLTAADASINPQSAPELHAAGSAPRVEPGIPASRPVRAQPAEPTVEAPPGKTTQTPVQTAAKVAPHRATEQATSPARAASSDHAKDGYQTPVHEAGTGLHIGEVRIRLIESPKPAASARPALTATESDSRRLLRGL
ncbi:MAG: hypothetical protein ACX931_04535 [Saccharospirillum sp.]